MASFAGCRLNEMENSKSRNHAEAFEDAFHSVCKYLDQVDEKKTPMEDIRKDADMLVSQFLECGRSCEQFFLQKNFQVANARPEQTLEEECSELRHEIGKKDTAVAKHHEKLLMWQQMLRSQGGQVQPMPGRHMQGQTIPTAYSVHGQPLIPQGHVPQQQAVHQQLSHPQAGAHLQSMGHPQSHMPPHSMLQHR